MADGKTVVVLGGGIGGVAAATALRRKLRGAEGHRVILVDKSSKHVFAPSLPWLMRGWREPDGISRDLASLERRGIEYVPGEVTKIDTSGRRVVTGSGDLTYDYLVISLGADLAPEAVPGLSEAAHTVYSLDGAEKLRDALPAFEGGRLAVLVCSMPFKCPAAPYETALLIEDYLRGRGLREKTDLRVITAEPQPMPVAGPVVGERIKSLLAQREIGYSPNTKVVSVEPASRRMSFEDGSEVEADLIVAIPPHRCPEVVKDAGLTGETGWAPVDASTLATAIEGVFAIGDVTAIKLPNGMMLPKAGVFAHGQAEAVANNIAAEVKGRGGRKEFAGRGACFVEVGSGRAAYASGNFYATPAPSVRMRSPGIAWHWGKVLYEKYWLSRI